MMRTTRMLIAAAALAAVTLLAPRAAHAGVDFFFGFGIPVPVPYGVVAPYPPPVVVVPPPVYYRPPVYYGRPVVGGGYRTAKYSKRWSGHRPHRKHRYYEEY